MYHGLAGSLSAALFQAPRFPTAGIIASHDQGAGDRETMHQSGLKIYTYVTSDIQRFDNAFHNLQC